MLPEVDPGALVAAIFGLVVLVQMLVTGSAAPNTLFWRRDEAPAVYWTVFVGISLAILLMLYMAFRKGSPV